MAHYAKNPYSQADKARVKTSPSSPHISPNQPRQIDETVVPFHFSQYPFLNSHHSTVTTLKTTLNLKLNAQTLQNLVNVNHPNVISIRKISKTNPRDGSYQIHYSLYYQPVQFNIKYLMEHPQDSQRLYNLLVSFDLETILCSVLDYLQDLGISYLIRINDIGITNEGIIKVFIPPTAITDPKIYSQPEKCLHPILDWWERVLSSPLYNPFKRQKKTAELQPPKLQNFDDLLDQSIDENELQRQLGGLLDDDNEDKAEVQRANYNQLQKSTNSISKLGSIQMDKINKINQKVQNFKEKICRKEKKSIPKGDVNKGNKNQGTKGGINMGQNIIGQGKQFHQPILQNINCINIFNHNNHMSPRYTSIPQYYQPHPQPQPQLFLPRNTQPYNYPQQQQIYEQDDDSLSQDTYDLEFNNQYEGNDQSSKPTKCAAEQRDLSQHPKRKKEIKMTQFRSKNNVNAVCNKNYTESAGPLQFKQLVNKYIKKGDKDEPAKKSVGFKESQNSRSNSLGPKKISKQVVSPQPIHRTNSQNEFIANRFNQDRQIHAKVSQALQKTKNAIALLNKVKQNRNRNISIQ